MGSFIFLTLLAILCSVVDGLDYTEKPSVILVPGAFHQALVYEKVVNQLHQAQYRDVTVIDLPSVGGVVGRPKDTDALRSALKRRLDEGKDVLLVGNSYGATVIGEGVKGLKDYQSKWRPRGPAMPRSGRILGLVFISGYIPYISEVTNPESKPPVKEVSPTFFRFTDDGKVYWDNDLKKFPPSKTFYNLLTPNDAKHWARKLQFSSYDAIAANATYIPYTGDFRTIYVVGDYDNAVSPAWAQTFIDQPGAKFEVERQKWDHVPMLSRPEEVTKLLRKIVGDN